MQPEEAIPPHVLAAFEGEPHLTMPALAKVLKMDRKTLDRHREAQNLPVHIKGTGLERRHYVCTLADVAEFYRRTGAACQYSASKTRLITSTTSRSNVIGFTVPPSARMNVRLVSSSKGAKRKQPDL